MFIALDDLEEASSGGEGSNAVPRGTRPFIG
jgi:hypothetical protein